MWRGFVLSVVLLFAIAASSQNFRTAQSRNSQARNQRGGNTTAVQRGSRGSTNFRNERRVGRVGFAYGAWGFEPRHYRFGERYRSRRSWGGGFACASGDGYQY
jgi:hypothetical protein